MASQQSEGIWIALRDPSLLLKTRKLFARMKADFQDLLRLGRAQVSGAELQMVLQLLVEYESRGSTEIRALLEPIRRQLQSPTGRQSLGVVLEDRFVGLD